MRSASTTSRSLASQTGPSGTGCSGSSGICRRTAAVNSRISARIGVTRSEYANPSVTTPNTTRPSSSTLTIAPIPIGVSRAVQKWNWCGVEGLSSVATTRPSGGGWDMSQCGGPGCNSVGAAAAPSGEAAVSDTQIALDGVNAIEQAVPPVVGGADGGPLREDSAGDGVGQVRRPNLRSHLDPYQAVEDVLPFPGPQPKGPLADRREAAGLGCVDRGTMPERDTKEALEVRAVERQGRMALR